MRLKRNQPIIARLEAGSTVDAATGCWLWTRKLSRGYGYIRVAGRDQSVHRLVYQLLVGPIPAGLQLDHLCRVRHCINPEHLEPVTQAENIRRGLGGRLVTECPHGHHYSAENTYITPSSTRACRTCRRERNREDGRRRRAAAKHR